MEFIKKTILRVMTTGHTTGCTGTCYVIIPNTGTTYQIKINLVQDARDIGFFNAYVVPVIPPPVPPPVPGDTYYYVEGNDDVFTDDDGDNFVWEIPI